MAYILLQTRLPRSLHRYLISYAEDAGLTISQLYQQVLRVACISGRQRQEDPSPCLRVFNLYRLTTQSGELYHEPDMVLLSIAISGRKECYYLARFMRRRSLRNGQLLRMATRTFLQVLERRNRYSHLLESEPEEAALDSPLEYQWEYLARRDFARSLYII